ncbi:MULTISPECIES: hypothetical protein [unclassified Agarivorans]|uniref:hypothetical protein n=1 Tax=unclassified Agarivorans TaxID=2636026 RepID=UPI0026E22CC1|nr:MULTISPECIES: hypothetical protein [unclassified Agarivorans]MDO6688101.1 hypothetical protein [Agarivorans sp. 3_MG-2023]MDO6717696.1 hypothetical protein [Agarivorans sp. 2_MG-2023]
MVDDFINTLNTLIKEISENYTDRESRLNRLDWDSFSTVYYWNTNFWKGVGGESFDTYYKIYREYELSLFETSITRVAGVRYPDKLSQFTKLSNSYMNKNWNDYLVERQLVLDEIRVNLAKEKIKRRCVLPEELLTSSFSCRKKIIKTVLDDKLRKHYFFYDKQISSRNFVCYSRSFGKGSKVVFFVSLESIVNNISHGCDFFKVEPIIAISLDGKEITSRLYFHYIFPTFGFPFGNFYTNCWDNEDLFLSMEYYCVLFEIFLPELEGVCKCIVDP